MYSYAYIAVKTHVSWQSIKFDPFCLHWSLLPLDRADRMTSQGGNSKAGKIDQI